MHKGEVRMAVVDDVDAIRNVLSRFVDAWNRRDADRFGELYTDPHVDVNHTPAVETRAQTVADLRARFAQAPARLDVTSDDVLVFGEWAVQRGSIVVSGEGGARTLRYIEVLQRGGDGLWRVHWGIVAPAERD
jgi:uncharacterized protein (TIGR02246 family)